MTNIGKITQIIGAVLDIKFSKGGLPQINEAIRIKKNDGGELTVEVAQHLGDDTVRCIAMGPTDGLVRGMSGSLRSASSTHCIRCMGSAIIASTALMKALSLLRL